MIIKSVKLTNIRSYIRETIEFPEGSVLISGDIGSGKSTILLAIEFALFGIQHGQLSGEALLRNGAASGSVELRIKVGNSDVIINRKLKRMKDKVVQGTGYIISNGQKFEGSPTELKARIFEMLGYPKSIISKSKNLIFRYTVYTPQEAMKQILMEDIETRLDTLRRVFNIDRYKRVKDNATILIHHLKSERARMEGKAEGMEEKKKEIEELEGRLRKAKEDLEGLVPEEKRIAAEVSEKNEKVKALYALLIESKEAKKRIGEIERRVRELAESFQQNKKKQGQSREELEKLEEEVRKLTSVLPEEFRGEGEGEIRHRLEEARKEEQKLKSEIDKLEEKIEHMKRDLSKTEEKLREQKPAEIADKKREAQRIAEEIERLKKIIASKKEKEEARQKLEAEKSVQEKIIEESEGIVKRIEKLTECPTCRQRVDEEHKELIRKEESEKREKAKQKIASLEKEIEVLLKDIREIEEAEKQFQNLNEKLNRIHSEIAVLEEKERNAEQNRRIKEELEKELRESEQELSEKKSEFSKTDRAKELENALRTIEKIKRAELQANAIRERIQTLDDALRKAKEEIGKLNQEKNNLKKKASEEERIREEHHMANEELSKLKEKEREISKKKGSVEQEVKSLSEIIQRTKKELEEKEEAAKDAVMLSERVRWLSGFFVKLVDVVEKHVMLSVHNEFNELFTKWFEMLIQDQTIQAKLDDTFTPVVIQNGYDADVKYMSGGERTALALAYRLALNRVINDLISGIKTKDILILDEPTDGFSNEQLDNVRNVIEELPNKQIIIVSHEAKVESFVEHIIRVSKQEHVSSAAQVS